MRSTRPAHRVMLLLAVAAVFLGLLALQSATPTGTVSDQSGLGRTAHVASEFVGALGQSEIDAVRHSLDRVVVRRSQPGLVNGPGAGIALLGAAAAFAVVGARRRRNLVLASELPARAPPLLALR